MKATHGAAAPPTVYRALDFLLEHGFIHKLASINAFVGCHHPGSAAARGAVPDLRPLPFGDRAGGRAASSARWMRARARWASRRRRRRWKCTASARIAPSGRTRPCVSSEERPHPEHEAAARQRREVLEERGVRRALPRRAGCCRRGTVRHALPPAVSHVPRQVRIDQRVTRRRRLERGDVVLLGIAHRAKRRAPRPCSQRSSPPTRAGAIRGRLPSSAQVA